MIFEKKAKYPFVIANTDAYGKQGTHWWSILDIEPKTDILFFDSFGIDGLKNLIFKTIKKLSKNLIWD